MTKRLVPNLLHKDLSYQVHGAAIEVRKDFGPGHKETLYQTALAEELKRREIPFEKEKAIKVYSPKDGKYIGLYRPDFVVGEKIIIELKAEKFVDRNEIKRVYDYLRNSNYELAYFINFASPKLYVKRVIFTNERKPFLKTLLASISLLLVLFGGLPVRAAEMFFGAHGPEAGTGSTFEVGVFINTEGESINAIEGELQFPSEGLELQGIRDGSSVVSFWVTKPEVHQEGVSFSGIIPGGYAGADGYLFSAFFRARKPGEMKITLASERVLLNDGNGSDARVRTAPLLMRVAESGLGAEFVPPDDADPPEPFEPYAAQDASIFNGKWFIAFATQDKGSGMDHYEIKEATWGIPALGTWRVAESPYVLKDQKLRSAIHLKAVDRAGNERIAMLPPQNPHARYNNYIIWAIVIVIGAAVCLKRNLWVKIFRA